jgi:putative hydroxymethylpyrimidine transporter CytX
MKNKTSVRANALIWFGAGVSIAEILTGTYFSTLGFGRGMAAILLGHLIGGALMFAAGMIGAREEKSAMETVKMSFGQKGSILFSSLNVLQLVGWTAIMIYDGALAANGIFSAGTWVWALIIGGLILVWILIGLTNLGKVNTVAMAGLLVLSIILFGVIFFGNGRADAVIDDSLSFGAAVELAVAMPLSWLPLISDYTREAEKPFEATLASVVVYSLVSIFMYMIGMGASIFTGSDDIASIMVKAGLGVAGLLIIVFSTVTTTFLDAYSAGVSAVSISAKIDEKRAAAIVAVIGTVAAIIYPMDNITNFLYLIGSVFAPMIAVQIADYFILKKEPVREAVSVRNLLIWLAGFVLYRFLMGVDTPVGNTLPDMAITILLCLIVNAAAGGSRQKKGRL